MALSRKIKVVALSSSNTLKAFVGIATAAVLSRLLEKTDYATYRQTLLAVNFVLPFLTLGLTNSINYYLPVEKKRERGLVNDALITLILVGGIFTVFIFLGGNKILADRFNNPALEHTLFFVAPETIFIVPITLLSAVLVVREKVALLSIFNILSKLSIGIGIIVAALVFKNIEAPLIINVVFSSFSGLVAIIIISRSGIGSRAISFSSMIKLVKFGLPLGIATILGTITKQMDKVIVSSMVLPEEFAVYVNGAMEIPLIGIITGSITAVILPDLRRMISIGNRNGALNLFHKVAIKSSQLLFPVATYLFICAESIMVVLYSEKYIESALPFRLYLTIIPIRIVQYGAIITSFGKNKIVLFQSFITLLLDIILSISLVMKFGYIGAVIATIIVLYFWSVTFNLLYIGKLFQTKWFNIIPFKEIINGNIYIILPVIITVFLEHFIKDFLNVGIRVILTGVVFFSIVLFFKKDEFISIRKDLLK